MASPSRSRAPSLARPFARSRLTVTMALFVAVLTAFAGIACSTGGTPAPAPYLASGTESPTTSSGSGSGSDTTTETDAASDVDTDEGGSAPVLGADAGFFVVSGAEPGATSGTYACFCQFAFDTVPFYLACGQQTCLEFAVGAVPEFEVYQCNNQQNGVNKVGTTCAAAGVALDASTD